MRPTSLDLGFYHTFIIFPSNNDNFGFFQNNSSLFPKAPDHEITHDNQYMIYNLKSNYMQITTITY